MASLSDTAKPSLAKRARRRRRLIGSGAALLILALAYAGLWLMGVSRAGAAFDAWLEREAASGRIWTCLERRFSGFPLGIKVDCAGPMFAGKIGGRGVTVAAGGVHGAVAIYRPDRVTARIDGPLRIQAENGEGVTIDWTKLDIAGEGLASSSPAARLDVVQPIVRLTRSGHEAVALSAAEVFLETRLASPGGPAGISIELSAQLTEVVAPLLDQLLGSQAPASAQASVHLRAAEAMREGRLPEALEAWREADGSLDIASLIVTKGPSRISATGSLALDDRHRPQGEIGATLSGMEEPLKRLGISAGSLMLGGLLSAFSGTRPGGDVQEATTAQGTTPGALHLKFTLADGRVMVGPLPLPIVLPPIY